MAYEHLFVTCERKKMLSWSKDLFFLRSLVLNKKFMDVCLCSNSGRFHGILFIPNPCCSSAMCMAGSETHGALAHSLVPAALGSAKLGLCMVLVNTKYVAAAQKGFVVQAQPFAHS